MDMKSTALILVVTLMTPARLVELGRVVSFSDAVGIGLPSCQI